MSRASNGEWAIHRQQAMQGFCGSLRARANGVMGSMRLLALLCLAAALVGQPALAGLHVALASHDHRYCPEHGQFEDVVRSPAGASGLEPPTGSLADSAALDLDDRLEGAGHARCAVLNATPAHGSPGSEFTLRPPRCPLLVTLGVPAPVASESVRSVLRLAPKRSPPSFA